MVGYSSGAQCVAELIKRLCWVRGAGGGGDGGGGEDAEAEGRWNLIVNI